jgi:trigger factor
VRERLARSARLEQAGAARDAVLEKLLTLVEVPLPEAAVSEELLQRRSSIEQQLAYAGLTQDEYLEAEGQTADEFATDLDKRVRDAMTAQFVLDDIADAESLAVSEQELTEHILRRAQQSGQPPEEFVRHVMEHNHVPEYVAEVRRGKALAHVVESASVTDSAGSAVELKTLLPDGTYGDPEAAAAESAESDDSATATGPDDAASVVATADYLDVDKSES